MVISKRYADGFFKSEKDNANIKKDMVVDSASHLRKTLPRLVAIADKRPPKKDKEYIRVRFPSEELAHNFFSLAHVTLQHDFLDAFRILPIDVKELNRLHLHFGRIEEIEELFTSIRDDSKCISTELDVLSPSGSHLANVHEMLSLEQKVREYKSVVETRLTMLFQCIRFQRDAL